MRRLILMALVFALAGTAPSPLEAGQQTRNNEGQFSQAVAESLLGRIREGLRGHSRRTLLSAFDRDRMQGYRSFERQIAARFDRYESFRVHYNVVQVTSEGSQGVVLADFELEEAATEGGPPIRRSGRLRFTIANGKHGWKVVELSPRSFF